MTFTSHFQQLFRMVIGVVCFSSLLHADDKKLFPSVSYDAFPIPNIKTTITAELGTPVGKAEMDSPEPDDFPPCLTVWLEDARSSYIIRKNEGSYFFPSHNCLRVYSISGVKSAPYKTIQPQIATLRKILKNRPSKVAPGTASIFPDYPPRNAAHAFEVKVAYVDAPWGSGVCYITQFTQDGSSPANNEELLYLFQGLSKDGAYYLSADFSITHPKLPNSFRDSSGDRSKGGYEKDYALLSKQAEGSFSPSLTGLQKWLKSIKLE